MLLLFFSLYILGICFCLEDLRECSIMTNEDNDLSLSKIDEAIEHTPTVIDLYSAKVG